MRQGETPLLPVRGRWGCTPPLAPWSQLNRVLKNLRSPFDKLRANGAGIAIVGDLPFVLSLSKHENDFFSTLLGHPDSYALGAFAETRVLTSSSPKARIVTSKRSCMRASFSPRSRVKQQYSSCMPLGSLK